MTLVCRRCLLVPLTGDAGLAHWTAPHVFWTHTHSHNNTHAHTRTHTHSHAHCLVPLSRSTPVPAHTASPSGSRVRFGVLLAWMPPGCVPQPRGGHWSPWVSIHVRGTMSDIGSRHTHHPRRSQYLWGHEEGPQVPSIRSRASPATVVLFSRRGQAACWPGGDEVLVDAAPCPSETDALPSGGTLAQSSHPTRAAPSCVPSEQPCSPMRDSGTCNKDVAVPHVTR